MFTVPPRASRVQRRADPKKKNAAIALQRRWRRKRLVEGAAVAESEDTATLLERACSLCAHRANRHSQRGETLGAMPAEDTRGAGAYSHELAPKPDIALARESARLQLLLQKDDDPKPGQV